jgi:O-antigen ligase
MLRASAGAIAWTLAAIFFTSLLVAVFRIDHVGAEIEIAVLLVATLAAVSPAAALPVLAAIVPIAAFVVSRYANPAVAWPGVLVVAGLTGFSLHALTRRVRGRHLHSTLAVPAILFGALVIASMVAHLAVMRLRFGPAFGDVVVSYLTRSQFFDARSFPALHAGLLLLEGLVLFAVVARECEARPALMPLVLKTSAIGAVFAAAINVFTLARAAARGDDFWSALARYASTLRWSVPYADVNAAGSYFLMGALLAAGAGAAVTGVRRVSWAAAAVLVSGALWLTGSRAAVLAGILGVAVTFAIVHLSRAGSRHVRRAAALAAVACLVGIGLTAALPKRGTQKSTSTALDVRLGLAQASARMIASRPVFGIGLGEFYQRSGEFSSPDLVQLFPPAVHENAHNNFLQVAAELGLAGGLTFAWLIAAILTLAFRGAARTRRAADTLRAAAVAGFIITWLGGHPLLIPDIAFPFWIAAGALAGGMLTEQAPREPVPRRRALVAVALLVIAVTLPWRMRTMLRETDLEHVGFGVSGWTGFDDTERYRAAVDHATLFVPADQGFGLRVKPLTDHPIPLELRLDGRVADVVVLVPNQWNDIRILRRSERPASRFSRLDLRLDTLPDKPVTMRITKVVPRAQSATSRTPSRGVSSEASAAP